MIRMNAFTWLLLCAFQVLSRCYQLLASVFQGPCALAEPYLRALGTPLVVQLKQTEKNRPQSAGELQAVQDGVRALETLVLAAPESQRQYFITIQSSFQFYSSQRDKRVRRNNPGMELD